MESARSAGVVAFTDSISIERVRPDPFNESPGYDIKLSLNESPGYDIKVSLMLRFQNWSFG